MTASRSNPDEVAERAGDHSPAEKNVRANENPEPELLASQQRSAVSVEPEAIDLEEWIFETLEDAIRVDRRTDKTPPRARSVPPPPPPQALLVRSPAPENDANEPRPKIVPRPIEHFDLDAVLSRVSSIPPAAPAANIEIPVAPRAYGALHAPSAREMPPETIPASRLFAYGLAAAGLFVGAQMTIGSFLHSNAVSPEAGKHEALALTSVRVARTIDATKKLPVTTPTPAPTRWTLAPAPSHDAVRASERHPDVSAMAHVAPIASVAPSIPVPGPEGAAAPLPYSLDEASAAKIEAETEADDATGAHATAPTESLASAVTSEDDESIAGASASREPVAIEGATSAAAATASDRSAQNGAGSARGSATSAAESRAVAAVEARADETEATPTDDESRRATTRAVRARPIERDETDEQHSERIRRVRHYRILQIRAARAAAGASATPVARAPGASPRPASAARAPASPRTAPRPAAPPR